MYRNLVARRVVPGSLIGVITMVRDERRSEPGTLEL